MDQKICRLCCDEKGSIYIFSTQNEVNISTIITYCCANVKVCKDDGLPDHICNSCNMELAASYAFILKCEASHQKLQISKMKGVTQNDLEGNKPKLEIKSEEYEDFYDDTALCESVSEEVEQCDNYDGRQQNSKKIKEKHRCNFCRKECANNSSLVIHLRSHTNEKPCICPICSKQYKYNGALKRHMERNHEERSRKFICENCGKGFFTKNDVKIHLRIHTGETPYECSMCHSRFTQVGALIRHKKRHTGERNYACGICKKTFCTKDEMKNHEKAHTAQKNIPCSLCNGLFKYQNSLKKHMKVHLQPKSFVCNYCGRTFNAKGNLKSHIDNQHSEKSGFCKSCLKSVSNFEVHMWKHTGQRPLKCELCTSSFYDLRSLGHHIAFRHKNADKFKCDVEGCLRSFPSKPMLNFHFAKLHGTSIPFPCDRCSRGFYRKNDLARHKIGTHKERLT